ncbi:MAG: hypothetical protein JW860_14015, partial [Sedimentisphaerales bacterium]|nr:hypothetical protein [Sedimentisphaerales bacterium]
MRSRLFLMVFILSIMLVITAEGASYSGYQVQSGRVEVTGTSTDISIDPVSDMSRAFVMFSYGTGYANISTNANVVMARGYLQAADNVRIERTSSSNSTWISYQVIECLDQEFIVYRGSDSMTTSETSKTLSIGGTVNPANCLALVTADSNSSSRYYYHQAMLTADVTSSTQVTIERNAGASVAPNFNWVVVEFDINKIADIQHGSARVSSVTYSSPATVSINTVDLNTSILIFQARPDTNGLVRTAWAGNFDSSSQIKFYQHTATSAADIEWYVVDFGGGVAQRGIINNSSSNTWLIADASLSSVDTSRAMNSHSMTCYGTSTYYPRAMSTAEFTSSTNLRIERKRSGAGSYIEWQVLELPFTESYIISGNAGIAGVAMSGLPGNPVSAGDGTYSATVDHGWSGTVIPTLTGYTFTPSERPYTDVQSDQLNQDYTP